MPRNSKKDWIAFLFLEGQKVRPQGITKMVFVLFAIACTLFCIWLSLYGQLAPYSYSVMFFTLVIPMAFLILRPNTKDKPSPYWFDWLFAILTFMSSAYLMTRIGWVMERVVAFDPLTSLDKIASVICMLAVLELCRRGLGWGFTIIVLLGISYAFFGHHLSGLFYHRVIGLEHFYNELIFTPNGVFGTPIAIVASYALLFVTFGLFYERAGGGKFIFDIASSLTGRQTGGQAKVAVVASGAFGTISGSPSADVATTGSVTIPMMKKSGYSAVFAGGVESAASTGGALLPPIMGTAAFLMAEFTGISYANIIISSIVTGLLYYYVIFLQVHFRSHKMGFLPMREEEIPNVRTTLFRGWLYILPVIALIIVIFSGFSPSRSAIFGLLTTIVISWFFKEYRVFIKGIIKTVTEVLYMVAPLVVATAAAGMLIGIINLTGLAGKFTALIFSVAGDSLFLVLLISAAISILLGMGMPTPAVYVLTATLVAPPIIEAGVPLLEAHLFLIFFASMSAITPPVGVAAYTAAGIAEASPLKIGATAVKLAIAAFLLPFMFVYQPALILQDSVIDIIIAIIFACIGLLAVASGVEGYFTRRLNWWKRLILVVVGIVVTYPELLGSIMGSIVIFTILWMEYRSYQKSKLNIQTGGNYHV